MKVSGPRWDAAGGVHCLPSPDGATGTLLACAVDVVGPDPEAALDEFVRGQLVWHCRALELYTKAAELVARVDPEACTEELREKLEQHAEQ